MESEIYNTDSHDHEFIDNSHCLLVLILERPEVQHVSNHNEAATHHTQTLNARIRLQVYYYGCYYHALVQEKGIIVKLHDVFSGEFVSEHAEPLSPELLSEIPSVFVNELDHCNRNIYKNVANNKTKETCNGRTVT